MLLFVVYVCVLIHYTTSTNVGEIAMEFGHKIQMFGFGYQSEIRIKELQSTIKELQFENKELQSTIKELQSAVKELQSSQSNVQDCFDDLSQLYTCVLVDRNGECPAGFSKPIHVWIVFDKSALPAGYVRGGGHNGGWDWLHEKLCCPR